MSSSGQTTRMPPRRSSLCDCGMGPSPDHDQFFLKKKGWLRPPTCSASVWAYQSTIHDSERSFLVHMGYGMPIRGHSAYMYTFQGQAIQAKKLQEDITAISAELKQKTIDHEKCLSQVKDLRSVERTWKNESKKMRDDLNSSRDETARLQEDIRQKDTELDRYKMQATAGVEARRNHMALKNTFLDKLKEEEVRAADDRKLERGSSFIQMNKEWRKTAPIEMQKLSLVRRPSIEESLPSYMKGTKSSESRESGEPSASSSLPQQKISSGVGMGSRDGSKSARVGREGSKSARRHQDPSHDAATVTPTRKSVTPTVTPTITPRLGVEDVKAPVAPSITPRKNKPSVTVTAPTATLHNKAATPKAAAHLNGGSKRKSP
eukprot:gene24978-212_t